MERGTDRPATAPRRAMRVENRIGQKYAPETLKWLQPVVCIGAGGVSPDERSAV